MKESVLRRDPILPIACNEVLKNVPCIESIILCGSRATAQPMETLNRSSDYDIALVMETFTIPLYLRKIKIIESKLSKRFSVKVNLNPLPLFRVRRAKGNLFLFKLKRDGITLYGKDYIKSLDPGDTSEIRNDWYFFYLFYSMKELIKDFDPTIIFSERNNDKTMRLTSNANKALSLCAELFLWIEGLRKGDELTILKFNKDLESVKRNLDWSNEPLKSWFQARDILLEAFQILMQIFVETHDYDLSELVTIYLNSNRDKPPFKNMQYLILILILKRRLLLRALFSRYLIADRLFSALVWLLLSIDNSGALYRENLDRAYNILRGYMSVYYFENPAVLWKHLRDAVCVNWSYACTALGI